MVCLIRGCGWVIVGAVVAAVAAMTPAGIAAEDTAAKVDFQKDVAPILRQQCIECHGPAMQMAELRLDQRRFVLGDDSDPDLVKAGKSGDSLLIKRLVDPALGILMPPSFPFPPGEKVGLPEASIQVLKAWIDQGADWPQDVSLASEAADTAESPQARALFAAIRGGNHQSAAELLNANKQLVNTQNRHGETPLMQAAVYSDATMVKLLLDHGADVNAAISTGATALMRAAGDFDKA